MLKSVKSMIVSTGNLNRTFENSNQLILPFSKILHKAKLLLGQSLPARARALAFKEERKKKW